MALCLEKKGYFDKANQIFKAVAESRSIVLRAIANYRGSLLEMNAGQYLNARTRAYKTIALTGALSPTCDWALTLEQDCTFLAAEAVTRQVLSLCDADKELPREFLSSPEGKDPIAAGLNEAELQAILTSGIERLNSGLLAPQVRPVESISGSPGLNRWLVVCNGPGIEELIARFAANAALDVRWVRPEDRGQKTEDGGDWNHPVTLYLPAATAQQVAATAAGAAGLLAQIDDVRLDEAEPRRAGTITISNPAEYLALSEHSRELSENAMWLWRAFLLMYSDDARIPNVHFALGVLQESRGRLAEAITEYKLVANRYSRTSIAPFALLHSSRLKTSLRDYTGASRDLKQLIEQYPDNVLVGEAHLNLAETTMKAGLYDDACSLYRKAYNLGFSAESQTIAAFGAGSCFYHTKDYESAVKWLTRYFDSLRKQQPAKTTAKLESQNSPDLYTAYLLLGKANLAMGNLEAACDALNRTVRSASASDEYVEAVSALVETQIKQENFVAALGTIENVRAWPFSQEQVTRLLLLKSNVLRAMGLADQAITALTDKVPYLTDSQLKADIMLELARCYVACANLGLAKEHLTEALSLVEPGPVAQQAHLELADVCLKLGDNQQTISICTQLLASSASEQTKQQASKILASAYSRQEDYDKAAEALLTASIEQ
jgi:tetratricopeptide (TPR) repeat protein